MRGVLFVLGLLGVIWLLAGGWITYRIRGLDEYCVQENCFALASIGDRLNFIAMNATAFTWEVTPVVVTLALFPLLFFVLREVRRRKRATKRKA